MLCVRLRWGILYNALCTSEMGERCSKFSVRGRIAHNTLISWRSEFFLWVGAQTAHPGCTNSTPCVHKQHTLGAKTAHPVCTNSTPWVQKQHTLGAKTAHPGCTNSTPWVHKQHTLCAQTAHPGCTNSTRCVHKQHTLGAQIAHPVDPSLARAYVCTLFRCSF